MIHHGAVVPLRTAPLSAGDAALDDRGPQGPAAAVGTAPAAQCLRELTPLLASWAVVLAGRRVCLLAQRVPPLVVVVRAVRRRSGSLR